VTFAPAQPLDVALTLAPLRHGRADPSVRQEGLCWWLVFRTPGGTATLRLRPRQLDERGHAHAVEASAWGAGRSDALAAVPGLLGAFDEHEGFDPGRHPVVRELARRHGGLRLARTGRVLDALVPAVLEQKVTGQEARASWRTLLSRHGEPAPGPAPEGMRVPPPAAVWRAVPSWEWHRAGVTPARSATIMRAVRVAEALEVPRPAAETMQLLRGIPGVGPWTAAEVVQRSHGHPDAVSVGDLHLCKRVGTALAGRRLDDAGMLALLEPWRGHRQRVVRLVEAAGIGYERHAPRLERVPHRRW